MSERPIKKTIRRGEVGPCPEDQQDDQGHKRRLAPLYRPSLCRHGFSLVLQSHLVVMDWLDTESLALSVLRSLSECHEISSRSLTP
jgi:hypothetical protein